MPELAKRVGVTSESVYNWEGGTAVPGKRNLAKLAYILRTSSAYLHYGVQGAIELTSFEDKEEGEDGTASERGKAGGE